MYDIINSDKVEEVSQEVKIWLSLNFSDKTEERCPVPRLILKTKKVWISMIKI